MEYEIDEFITYIKLEKKLSKNTIDNYNLDLVNYIKYLENKEIYKLNNITLNDIKDYLQHLSKEGLNSRSIRRHITTIKEFHRYLVKFKKIKNV